MRRIFPFVILFYVAIVSGCGTPSSPSNGTPQWGALNTISGLQIIATGDSTFGRAVAQFWDGTQSNFPTQPVDTVTMNGLGLKFNGELNARLMDDPSIYTDSIFHWHVVGGKTIDSFDTTSIRPAHLRIYSLRVGDTVFKSQGIQVAWTNADTSSTVSVEIDDSQKHSEQVLSIKDLGTATITADQIPNSQTGPITLTVYRTHIEPKVIGSKGYVLTSISKCSIMLNLK